MPRSSPVQLLRKESAEITRKFTKLVKVASKGNQAFVIGYMDGCAGRPSNFRGISDSFTIAYSQGWQTATGQKRKSA